MKSAPFGDSGKICKIIVTGVRRGKESSINRYNFVVLALALVSFKPTASFSATNLTIGHSTINPRIAPLWIAQEKGYFQKYGIDATLFFVRNTPLMIAAMKAGTIPIAYGGGSWTLIRKVSPSRVSSTNSGLRPKNHFSCTAANRLGALLYASSGDVDSWTSVAVSPVWSAPFTLYSLCTSSLTQAANCFMFRSVYFPVAPSWPAAE